MILQVKYNDEYCIVIEDQGDKLLIEYDGEERYIRVEDVEEVIED